MSRRGLMEVVDVLKSRQECLSSPPEPSWLVLLKIVNHCLSLTILTCVCAVLFRPQSSIHARVWKLKQEAVLITEVLAMLEQERKNIELHLALAHNALLPICRLPDELLSIVFEIQAPFPGDTWQIECDEPWFLDDYMEYVASVSKTCSRFRVIVLRNPRCWSSIRSSLSFQQGDSTSSFLELASYLSRSKKHPFNLALDFKFDKPEVKTFKKMLTFLEQHMERCQTLQYVCHEKDVLHLISPSTPLAALRHLSITWKGSRHNPTSVPIFAQLVEPLLNLWLSDMDSDEATSMADFLGALRMDCLTRLSLGVHLQAQDCVQILSRCSSLKQLHIKYPESTQNAPQSEAISLPFLVSMSLTGAVEDDWRSLRLDCPQLSRVWIATDPSDTRHLPSILQEPVSAPSSLIRLAYQPHNISQDALERFMHLHTRVEELAWFPRDMDGNKPQNRSVARCIKSLINSLPFSDPTSSASSLRRLVLVALIGPDVEDTDQLFKTLRLLLNQTPQLCVEFFYTLTSRFTPSETQAWQEKCDLFTEQFSSRITIIETKDWKDDILTHLGWPSAWRDVKIRG